jgi:hypothetical protein
LFNVASDIVRPIPATAMNWAQIFGNLGTRAAGGKAQTGEQFWQGPGTDQVAKFSGGGNANNLGTTRNVIGNAAQVALYAAPGAPEALGLSTAAKVGIDAGLGASGGLASVFTNEPKATKSDYLKAAGIGGVLGGIAAPVTGFFAKGINKLRGGEAAAAERFISKLAESDDAGGIARELGKAVPTADKALVDEASTYLAGETNPDTIRSVIDNLQHNAGGAKLDPTVRDAMHPNPDSIPEGYHAEGAPDPNALINEQNAAKAAETAASKLPEGDIAAIKEAGGVVPTNAPEVLDTAAKGVAATKDPAAIETLVDKVLPGVSPEQKSVLVQELVKTEDPEAVVQKFADQIGKADGVAPTPVETPTAAPTSPEAQKVEQALEQAPAQSGVSDAPIAADGSPTTTAPADANIGGAVSENADQAVEQAKQQVLDSLDSAQSSYDEVAAKRSQEKAGRASQGTSAYEDVGGGAEGLRAKLAAQKGKYSESGFQPIEIAPDAKNALLDDIEKSSMQEYQKLNTQVALSKVFGDVAGKPTPSDIRLLREHFGDDFANKVEEAVTHTFGEKARDVVGQIAGLPKSLKASFDLSGAGRQGGVLGTRFPKEAASAFKEQLKYFASTKAYEEGMQEIASRPTFAAMEKAGLAVDAAHGITNTEEQFVSNLAEKIPGFGRGIAASDRAYSGFLAKLRADVFDNIVTKAEGAGVELSDKALSDIARFVNTASGRGDLGMLEKHSQTLGTALFSPRLWKSRLDMLNPVYYAKLDPVARKYALQNAGTFAATAGAVLSAAALAGAQVETDARSSDFLKIKVGNTRYDILGGLQQNLVFAWREISGEKKNSETGEVTSLADGKFGQANRLSAATDFITNKENPLLAAGQRILQGKDRGGNDVNPLAEVAKLAIPLGAQNAYQNIQDIGSIKNPKDIAKGLAMSAPDVIGVSGQTYGTIASKDKGPDGAVLPGHEKAIPEFKGKIEPNMVTDSNGKVIQDDKGKPITVKFPKGATELEKQAILDEKRTSAVADQFKKKLSTEDQALLKLQPKILEQYRKDGRITQEQFDHIEQTQQDIKNLDGVETPEGAVSDAAKNWFTKYNGMTKANQKKFLDSAEVDDNGKAVAEQVNKARMPGLSEFKPSNKLTKAYAEFEQDMNTHPEYTEVDKRNKTKAFQTFAYKQNYNNVQQDIYAEGGSDDLRQLLKEDKVSKDDLNAAITMDNELYNSGLTGSLKFSKKFRSQYGYGVPAGSGSGSGSGGSGKSGNGGSTKSINAHLTALLPSFKADQGGKAPTFSSIARSGAGNPRASFKAPTNIAKGSGKAGTIVAPFQPVSLSKLRKTV